MTEQPPVTQAAVSGYAPVTPAPPTSSDPLGYVHAIEGDVANAINHPSPTTIHKAAADLVTILGVLAAAVGFVQSVIPASRGTESTLLAGIGSGIVLVRSAIERFAR